MYALSIGKQLLTLAQQDPAVDNVQRAWKVKSDSAGHMVFNDDEPTSIWNHKVNESGETEPNSVKHGTKNLSHFKVQIFHC